MYVELGSHVYSLSDGATREFQRSFTFCQEKKKIKNKNNNEAESAGMFMVRCFPTVNVRFTVPQSFHKPP